jgi:hypothetical protein
MPFQYILANLLAQNDGAVGVMFLDGTGETIDMQCADFPPYQMKVIGAYLGIYQRQIEKFLEAEPQMLHIEKDSLHIYCMALPDEYYLVLVQRRPAIVGRARATMTEAADQLRAALF